MTRFKRIAITAFLAVVAAIGIGAVSATPAAASATGCQLYGGGNINGQWYPSGQWCASVNGSGTYVNGTSGSFNSPWGNVCNYRTQLRFIDGTNGSVYRTVDYGINWRCDHAAFMSFPGLNYNARRGKIEIRLIVNGGVLATVRTVRSE